MYPVVWDTNTDKALQSRINYLSVLMIMILLMVPDHGKLFAQKILLIEKQGTVKNYKYRLNDNIIIKTTTEKTMIKGTINKLTDSSLVINYNREIKYKEITDLYKPMWVKHWVPELLIKASLGYFIVVGVNNILQHVYPVMPADVLLITAGLMGSGILANHLLQKHYHLTDHWRIRLLDFEKLE